MSEHERSPGEQRVLDQLLEHLQRNSDDERLRELATGVLAGDISLNAALSADAYTESLRPGLTRFADWYHDLDADALAEELTRSRSHIDHTEGDSTG